MPEFDNIESLMNAIRKDIVKKRARMLHKADDKAREKIEKHSNKRIAQTDLESEIVEGNVLEDEASLVVGVLTEPVDVAEKALEVEKELGPFRKTRDEAGQSFEKFIE